MMRAMRGRFLEEFTAGEAWETRALTLTEGMIIDFALMWDPQHMHIDKPRSESGPFNGLIASGFHTLVAGFRLFHDLGLLEDTNIVGPSIGEVSWPAPVYPGDTIRSLVTVTEVRPSKSRPDRGLVHFSIDVVNQKNDVVCRFHPRTFVRSRTAGDG